MKHTFKFPQALFLLVAVSMTLLSVNIHARSNGPAQNGLGDRTGSPLSSSTCSLCHGGGSFDAVTVIRVFDESGSAVNEFIAGDTYMITVEVTNGIGSPDGYGFQLTLLDELNETIGIFSTPSAGSGLVNLSNQVIWEHTQTDVLNSFTVLWDAPAKESTVTIYAVGNAVNNNGGTSGDSPSASASFSADIIFPAEWIFLNGFE